MFVFAAGGTGGHIIPALAVAEALQRLEPTEKILFIGVGSQMERKLISGSYPLEEVPYTPVLGKGPKAWLAAVQGFKPALDRLAELYRLHQPTAVIGFGGYPSVMPIIAARIHGIPRLLHEQNAKVGLANKFLSLFCNKVYAVPRAEGFWGSKHLQHLSNPVRADFLKTLDWQKPADGGRYTLLIVGGSQGAVAINDAILANIERLKQLPLNIMHVAGWRDYDRVLKAYGDKGVEHFSVHAFVDDLAPAYGKAHLVVCRAGAMTAAEVSAAGRPAIFIPLNIASAHQAENVKHLIQNDAAELIVQDEQLADKLIRRIEDLLEEPDRLAALANNARTTSREGAGGKSSAEVLAEALLAYRRQGPR